MNDLQKAEKYSQLMFEYTRIENKISSIKGESINLNENQINEIKVLESRLRLIVESASRL
jgi:hypothetical protein